MFPLLIFTITAGTNQIQAKLINLLRDTSEFGYHMTHKQSVDEIIHASNISIGPAILMILIMGYSYDLIGRRITLAVGVVFLSVACMLFPLLAPNS